MNVRIQELKARAIEEALQNGATDFSVYPVSFDEKFAKLIIQDCVSQIAMIGVSNCENDDVGWTVDKSIENIRKHFEVES